MDRIVFPMLLLTGFCIPSASLQNVYYFIREKMTWGDAQEYCVKHHAGLAQIQNIKNVAAVMNTPTGGYADKAWIGLHELSEWMWADGQPVRSSNWAPRQPDGDEMCVAVDDGGYWNVISCSQLRPYVCHDADRMYHLNRTKVTWISAKTGCEDNNMFLASIMSTDDFVPDKFEIKDAAWIGLHRVKLWYWSQPGGEYDFMNWQDGQPDVLSVAGRCAAVVLTDGTWADEYCNATYPFFCNGIYTSRKTVVRMKMQSSANMEDPVLSADLLRQLALGLANQGVTDFKLTWKKLPVKQTRKRQLKYAC